MASPQSPEKRKTEEILEGIESVLLNIESDLSEINTQLIHNHIAQKILGARGMFLYNRWRKAHRLPAIEADENG